MSSSIHPGIFLPCGFVLMVAGFLIPLLMILQVIESTLFLNFLAYTMMILGNLLGFIGIVFLVVRRRR